MNKITFKVNGVEYTDWDLWSSSRLVDFLRSRLGLRGTKFNCREGGCGACIVAAVTRPGELPKSINSCLVLVASCHGWEITTIEGIGNSLDGYHPIQKMLAKKNGTQCGYCSPGFVMAMYCILISKKDPTMLEIEKSFASNICRCTGYRPILDAQKTFAKDAPQTDEDLLDIEDLRICEKTGEQCGGKTCSDREWCFVNTEDVRETKLELIFKDGKKWYTVDAINDIFDIWRSVGDSPYMLVAGNTAKGVYPLDEYPNILIDITRVSELRGYKLDQNLIIGASTPIGEVVNIFKEVASTEGGFQYLNILYEHLELVANIPVKNLGTIAGNLMIKHTHNEFPSDLFLLFETCGADLTIMNSDGTKEIVSMQKFLQTDMNKKILYNLLIPPYSAEHRFVTYKIMPRSQNAHALVNAGFMYKMGDGDIVQECRIVFGNISSSFIRASQTESLLVGKNLFDNQTLKSAVTSLKEEINPVENPPEVSAKYRKQLAIGLFYKGLLYLCPRDKVSPRYASGAKDLNRSRPVSKGLQEYSSDPAFYPVNEPVQKVEALIQCAGEAKYTDDQPSYTREVYAAYATTKVALGKIESIDATDALKVPGVIAFYTAKDIPGANNFIAVGVLIFGAEEEVLCSGDIKHYDQPLGLVVAESMDIAERAAKLVKVTYSGLRKPVIDIKEAKKDPARCKLFLPIPAVKRGLDVAKVIKNEYTVYGQYHFYMEPMACVTYPSGEAMEVYSTTQWTDGVQICVSRALKIHQSKIDVSVRRVGGGFGGKISRSVQAAVACALVTQKLNRPCRFVQTLTSGMRSIGKRFPCSTNLEFGVNTKGELQYMNYEIYEDVGCTNSELAAVLGIDCYSNCYDKLKWNYKCFETITDNAKNTFCRSPVTFEHIAMAEWVMEQISYELSLDPLDVRMTNMDITNLPELSAMVQKIKDKSDYVNRRAATNNFNTENRWLKRGLRWAFMRWTPLTPSYYDVNLSVFHGDGSIVITHGGVELGQGINTKAVQVCAYYLKVPMEKIQVKACETTSIPNPLCTGSSVTSQNICRALEQCCKELLLRLAPIRLLLLNPIWEDLIKKAFALNLDLCVHGFIGEILTPPIDTKGVALCEVEVDILTGESQIIRVDLTEDVGRSISPMVDIGQVEGAFMMGVGYWTCEELMYAPSGELLTDRSWTYHVPQARDIPQDFRIYFKENPISPDIVLGAKVVGEPPVSLSTSVPFALREAITSARFDSKIPKTDFFRLDGPYTRERICLAAATNVDDFVFK